MQAKAGDDNMQQKSMQQLTCKQRQRIIITCVTPFSIYRCRNMWVMIVACYHPLPLLACLLLHAHLFACCMHLVSLLFGTSIPVKITGDQ